MVNPAVAAIYDKIPTFTCKAGCGVCCGVVPWSAEEYAAVASRLPAGATTEEIEGKIYPIRADGSLTCPFFDGGCTVYEDRPFMCRLFGTSRDPLLRCPVGCEPKRMLTSARARRLRAQYINKAG
jgi:Fe-S-cluster containining protein